MPGILNKPIYDIINEVELYPYLVFATIISEVRNIKLPILVFENYDIGVAVIDRTKKTQIILRPDIEYNVSLEGDKAYLIIADGVFIPDNQDNIAFYYNTQPDIKTTLFIKQVPPRKMSLIHNEQARVDASLLALSERGIKLHVGDSDLEPVFSNAMLPSLPGIYFLTIIIDEFGKLSFTFKTRKEILELSQSTGGGETIDPPTYSDVIKEFIKIPNAEEMQRFLDYYSRTEITKKYSLTGVGDIIQTAIPKEWQPYDRYLSRSLLCDGSKVSRVKYLALYNSLRYACTVKTTAGSVDIEITMLRDNKNYEIPLSLFDLQLENNSIPLEILSGIVPETCNMLSVISNDGSKVTIKTDKTFTFSNSLGGYFLNKLNSKLELGTDYFFLPNLMGFVMGASNEQYNCNKNENFLDRRSLDININIPYPQRVRNNFNYQFYEFFPDGSYATLNNASFIVNNVYSDRKGFPDLTVWITFGSTASVLRDVDAFNLSLSNNNPNLTPFSTRQETLFALLSYIYTGIDE